MKRAFLFYVVFLMGPVMACTGEDYYGPMGGWGHMMNYGYGGMFMWIIFLIIVGVAVYLIIQNAKAKGESGTSQETPLDILKRRYAKGEITKEEYDRLKRDLSE
jgi:putative membrane protein